MKRPQKIILGSIGVAVIALAGVSYIMLKRAAPSATKEPLDNSSPALYLPGAGETPVGTETDPRETKGLRQVISSNVAAFWIDESDLTIYTVTPSGSVVATPHQGSSDALYGGNDQALVSARPNPAGDMVLLTTGSRIEPTISIFNVITQKRTLLPAKASSAVWHPNGRDVLYIREADGKNPAGIYLLATARNTATQLAALSMIGVSLETYTTQAVLLVEPPTREAPVRSWVFDLAKKTLVSFEPPTPGLMVRWFGSSGLLFEPKAGLSLIRQGKKAPLGLEQVLPGKCALGTNSLFCAVPQDTIAKLPDSYLQREVYSVDALYEISFAGEQTRLWDGPSRGMYVDMYNLKKIGDTVYFINRYDNKLYSIGLERESE